MKKDIYSVKKDLYSKKIQLGYFIFLIFILTSIFFNFTIQGNLTLIISWSTIVILNFIFHKYARLDLLFFAIPISIYFILHLNYIYYLSLNVFLVFSLSLILIHNILKDTSKNKFAQILVILMIISLSVYMDIYEHKNSFIKDPDLKRVVKEQLKKDDKKITSDNLKKITYISSRNNSILKNLDGISNLNSLEVLSIDDATALEDYSELSHLTKLRYLSLGHSKLSNLLSAEKLNSLEILSLDKCNIDNNLNSEAFPNLKTLWLDNITIEDLSFIENLESLEELRLYKCKVKSLNGIENLVTLKKLNLTKSSIDNRDALKKIPNLEIISSTDNNTFDNIKDNQSYPPARINIRRKD